MVSFTSIITAAVAATGALAAPATDLATRSTTELSARGGTPSSAGMNNGCYYSWWTDNGAQATYTNGAKGQYSVNWQSGGNLVGGKGWKTGSPRYVTPHPTPTSRLTSSQHHLLLWILQVQRQLLPCRLRLDPQPSHRVLRR
jgi:hypothetical protein